MKKATCAQHSRSSVRFGSCMMLLFAGTSDVSPDGDQSDPTTASTIPFKRLHAVHRNALGWLPASQLRDLNRAAAITLTSASKAVRGGGGWVRRALFTGQVSCIF